MFGIWKTTFENPITVDNWLDAKCTCKSFLKNNLCKHNIGLAAHEKIIKIPDVAKNVPISQKRKRGRPSKSKHALEKQPIQKSTKHAKKKSNSSKKVNNGNKIKFKLLAK